MALPTPATAPTIPTPTPITPEAIPPIDKPG